MSVSQGPGTSREGPTEDSLIRLDERRRIARELHDSTSQLLVVLQLQLRGLQDMGHPDAEPLIGELRRTIGEIQEQVRGLDLDQAREVRDRSGAAS